jgi:hypothetical protein
MAALDHVEVSDDVDVDVPGKQNVCVRAVRDRGHRRFAESPVKPQICLRSQTETNANITREFPCPSCA